MHLLHRYVSSKIATEEIVKRLLQLGADVNGTVESECSVLTRLLMKEIDYAEKFPSEIVKICKLLLEHGADTNLGRVMALSIELPNWVIKSL